MTPSKIKQLLTIKAVSVYVRSVERAMEEQGLTKLADKLKEIAPDISNQYSASEIKGCYLNTIVRGVHAFQISLVDEVLKEYDKSDLVIVDIGDSAGTHIQYINSLYKNTRNIKSLSVNLDPKAIQRIKAKGLDAINARAEELPRYNIDPDIFMCFQTLEHIMDPCRFLHNLSEGTKAKYLIITVPYRKVSRVGLHYIRCPAESKEVFAEGAHIFELNPEDWKLIAKHSGWKIVHEHIYYQYPHRHLLSFTKPLWRKHDYEGYYGLILGRDNTWSCKYKDW